MLTKIVGAGTLGLLLASALWASPAEITVSSDPDQAKIVYEDIDRFWEAFDQAGPAFSAESFQKLYLDRGTPGLQDFITVRIHSAEALARTIRKYPRYYASIRESTRRIPEMERGIRASFYAFEYLYPEARFPDVYFLVGVLNTGGTTSHRGLLIGAEMYARTAQTPLEELSNWHRTVIAPVESVPRIVAHEIVHFQQRSLGTNPTLLANVIIEGSADFLGEMISGGHINEHVHRYAVPRRAQLWREFKERMHAKEFEGWLYSSSGDRPQDLGYWLGYEITKAYYEKAIDKRQAIREILQVEDFDAFLAKSGYEALMEQEEGRTSSP
jgi:hypothetical protein